MHQENNNCFCKNGRTNMTSKHAFRGGLAALAGIALGTVSFSLAAAQQSKLRIVQTNSAGDNIHIIDASTNKVVGEIKGIEAPHGVAVAPDGSWIYVAIALTWDDYSEFPQIKANPSGGVDVIDAASLAKVKTIPLRGGIHDLNVTPDGKYVIAGSSRGARPAANLMNVIDVRTNEVAWSLLINPAPSPMAISSNPDGSTKWIFAQNGSLNGFAVFDFATQAKINEIKLPDIPADQQNRHGGPSVSHGIVLTADQKTLLINSRLNSTLYAYSVPDLKLMGSAALGGKGAGWLVITPDDKTAYVANEHTNNVSVVDIKTMKEIALIPAGFAPARNATWIAP